VLATLDYYLSTLLLFAPDTYYRLFHLYNAAIWPWQFLSIVVVAILWVVYKRNQSLITPALLLVSASFFMVSAVGFLFQFYAPINWAAHYFAMLFLVQGVLIFFLVGMRPTYKFVNTQSWRWKFGIAFIGYAFIGLPLMDLFLRQDWRQIQWPGFTPDTAALLTLALLTLMHGKAIAGLTVIPFVWLTTSGLIIYTMGNMEGLLLIVIALVCLLLRLCPLKESSTRPINR